MHLWRRSIFRSYFSFIRIGKFYIWKNEGNFKAIVLWRWLQRTLEVKIRNMRHCVKSVQIRSFFWSVFSCIRTEYRKIQTRKNPVFAHFRAVSFTKWSKISTFITELCQILKRFYSLTDQGVVKSILTRHILSPLNPFMREVVRILQISENLPLETLWEFVDSKYHNNTQKTTSIL